MGKVEKALKGISNSELARKTGMSQGYISRLLRGDRQATVETLDRLAKALGVTLDEMHAHLKRVAKPEKSYGWKSVKPTGEAA